MKKQMSKLNKRKILGISLDTLLLFSMFLTEDISFLRFLIFCSVILLIVDTLIFKI